MKLTEKNRVQLPAWVQRVAQQFGAETRVGAKALGWNETEWAEDLACALTGVRLPPRRLRAVGEEMSKGKGPLDTTFARQDAVNLYHAYRAMRLNPTLLAFRQNHPKAGEWMSDFVSIYFERLLAKWPNDPALKGKRFAELWDMYCSSVLYDPYQFTAGGDQVCGVQVNCSTDTIRQVLRVREIMDRMRLDYVFAAASANPQKESMLPQDEIQQRGNKTLAELGRVTVGELLKDEDLTLRAVEGKAEVTSFLDPTRTPRKWVMLIDQSGSMEAEFSDGYTRAEFALACACALIKNALKGGNEAHIGLFDYTVKHEYDGNDPQVIDHLMGHKFSGGSTCIAQAVRWASQYGAEEVFLLSDGLDSVTAQELAVLGKTPLTTYMLGCDSDELKKGSTLYHRVRGLDGKLPTLTDTATVDGREDEVIDLDDEGNWKN